ncbi:MAG: hypothetical protein WCS55_07700 [Sulfuricurvum sp.]|jgi:hypothetical protein|uniref:hypothetical protein n=1 Tax=Sulfuricurvum sp. TaxID=2025608 RepID=UPI003564E026
MNKTQWYLIGFSTVILVGWMLMQFAALQSALSEPMNLPSSKPKPPEISPLVQTLFTQKTKDSLAFSNDAVWGIFPKIDPKNPTPNAVIFTPAVAGKMPRICVGISCYEFMGLSGKKGLFFDTNVTATKKTLSVGAGATLHKPLRVKQVTNHSIVILDTKSGTTYEMSLFKIDLDQYKPKSESPKGK